MSEEQNVLGELLVRPMVTTVVLHGELDLATVHHLRALLDDAGSRRPPRLVIDVSDVPFLDVLSLSAILAAADQVRDRGGMAAVTGASPAVRRICALLNAEDVLAADIPQQRRIVG